MDEKQLELAEYYERRIRKGFPSGEVKSELLGKGYSETEADNIIDQIGKVSGEQNVERGKGFRFFMGLIFITLGVIMLTLDQRVLGLCAVGSGVTSIAYELFFSNKKNG